MQVIFIIIGIAVVCLCFKLASEIFKLVGRILPHAGVMIFRLIGMAVLILLIIVLIIFFTK